MAGARPCDGLDLNYSFKFVGAGALSSVAWSIRLELVKHVYIRFSAVLFNFSGISSCHATRQSFESSSLILYGTFRLFDLMLYVPVTS